MANLLKYILLKTGLFYRLKYSSLLKGPFQIFYPGIKKQLMKEQEFYRSFLSPCTLIFDIGANDGHKTAAFAAMAKKVIACEPDTHNLAILKGRFRKKPNIVIEPFAITDHQGTEQLYIHQPGSALNTVNPQWVEILETSNKGRWKSDIRFTGRSVTVNTITLDDLIVKHGIPDLIKIDVEGNEKKVLAGLSHPVNFISFEVLLPEFLSDAIACMERVMQLNSGTLFNYAIDEKLALPQFIPYNDFKRLLKELPVPHLEIIASAK